MDGADKTVGCCIRRGGNSDLVPRVRINEMFCQQRFMVRQEHRVQLLVVVIKDDGITGPGGNSLGLKALLLEMDLDRVRVNRPCGQRQRAKRRADENCPNTHRSGEAGNLPHNAPGYTPAAWLSFPSA